MTSVIHTLDEARQQEVSYLPSDAIQTMLSQKILVAIVGPAGIGKSTTMDIVTKLDAHFGRTGGITTRPPQARDNQSLYKYFTLEQALTAINERQFVQYTVHPTTNNIYATDGTMYTHTYNMLETLPDALLLLKKVGFKHIIPMYMVTDATAWEAWFLERYPAPSDERRKRVREAIENLEWALAQPPSTIAWLYNAPNKQEATAQKLISIVKEDVSPTNERDAVHRMLLTIQHLM